MEKLNTQFTKVRGLGNVVDEQSLEDYSAVHSTLMDNQTVRLEGLNLQSHKLVCNTTKGTVLIVNSVNIRKGEYLSFSLYYLENNSYTPIKGKTIYITTSSDTDTNTYTINDIENGISTGIYKLQINFSYDGIYKYVAQFKGDNEYPACFTMGTFTYAVNDALFDPSSITTTILSKVMSFKIRLISVLGTPLVGKLVNLTLFNAAGDSKLYPVYTDDEGFAILNINLEVAGMYNMQVYFAGDTEYGECSASVDFRVNLSISDTSISLLSNQIKIGDYFKCKLIDGAGDPITGQQNVEVTFSGWPNGDTKTITLAELYTSEDDDDENKGVYGVQMNFTTAFNPYKYYISFIGDENYKSCSTEGEFNTLDGRIQTTLKNPTQKTYTPGGLYEVTLGYVEDNIEHVLAGQDVVITITNSAGQVKAYTVSTDAEGKAKLTINMPAYTYGVSAEYGGTDVYSDCSLKSTNLVVNKTETIINTTTNSIVSGNNWEWTLKDINGNNLKDSEGNPLSGLEVNITFTNPDKSATKTYSCEVIDGVFKQFINYDYAGNWSYVTNFPGTDHYTSSKKSGTLVLTVPTSKKNTKLSLNSDYIQRYTNLEITLKDQNDVPLANRSVNITIINTVNKPSYYTATTDSNGVAKQYIELIPSDLWRVNASFAGDNSYNGCNLSTDPVGFTVWEPTKTNTKFQNPSNTVSTPNGTYSIQLTNENGVALSGKSVTLTLTAQNNTTKTYYLTTNSNGYVYQDINLNGDISWKMKATFYEDNEYKGKEYESPLTVSKTSTSITSNDKQTFTPGGAFNVTLKRTDTGKGLANETVKIILTNLNNESKTYYRTTNSDGVATLNIDIIGGFTWGIYAKYEGSGFYTESNTYSDSLYVKKTETILTRSLPSGNIIKKGSNYTVILSDTNGNRLPAGKTIILTLKNTLNQTITYTISTNSSGVASQQITLIAATWQMSVNFPGDAWYEAKSLGFDSFTVID